MGQWHTTIVAQPQKTVAAPPQVANNSQAKFKGAASEPDLALKSVNESEKRIPTLTQIKPEAPPVVLLNPGTGMQKCIYAIKQPPNARAERRHLEAATKPSI